MKKFIIGAALLALTGCATYGDTTESQQLGSDVHRISMRGNAFNKTTDAQDFALLKAAEVAIDSGNKYFVISNTQDKTRHNSYTTQGTSTSNTYGTATANAYGNQYYATANAYGQSTTNTTFTPGQTYNFILPGVDLIIETFPEDKQPSGGHFNALEITKYLGEKYNPKRWAKQEEK